MSFIPEEDFKGRIALNLAPMIDFLFLLLIFFATLAVTRATTKDTAIDLVEIKPESARAAVIDTPVKIIHISIDAEGSYKWVTEIHDTQMATVEEIARELHLQHEKGLLPPNKDKTQIFLKIDKRAQWEPILKAVFAIREEGFEVRPVYEPIEG